VLLFVVVISAGFISHLLPNTIQRQLNNRAWTKHIVAIALLALTVVWTQDNVGPAAILGNTIVSYAWFLAMFEMNEFEFLTVVTLLLLTFGTGKMR